MAEETASKIQLFGKWTYDDVEVNDISLEDYIAVNKKHCVYLPHTAGRYARKRFRKVCPDPRDAAGCDTHARCRQSFRCPCASAACMSSRAWFLLARQPKPATARQQTRIIHELVTMFI